RLVLNKLELEPGVVPGEISSAQVGVPAYRGAPPQDCEYLLHRLCDWLNSDSFRPPDVPPVVAGLIRAIMAHLYLAWIHPFGNGNGRTARLVEFQILVSAGTPKPAAHLLSNHYNLTRDEYYRQLSYASKSGGNILPFIEYAVQGLIDGLKQQLDVIRGQQWSVAWTDYVHGLLGGEAIPAVRRRHLILDLSEKSDRVSLQQVTHVSPRTAEAYAKKKRVTLMRDLRILESMGLLEIDDTGVRARRESILAFLPARKLSTST
ncbi:MAG: Fic family protein, partial [candidate division Zixibacteria bacterium]|nr:Fic family protein [candidate division Zixibacteria bacterium]